MKKRIMLVYKNILNKLRITTTYDTQEQRKKVNDIEEQLNSAKMSIKLLKDSMQTQMNDIESTIENNIDILKNGIHLNAEQVRKMKEEISSIEKKRINFEEGIYKGYEGLEYKLYEFNKSANILFYENKILLNKLQNNIRKDFNPRVSIIIPAYNASQYIKEAIDSALGQTYENIEVIVVDDGSEDNGATERICLSYGDKIKYYKKENGGVSSALNLGIQVMTGDYFAWLSHDDIYYPDNIYEHIRCLENNRDENIITFSNFNIIDEYSNVKLNETIKCNIFLFDYKINQIKPEYSLLQGEINGGSVLIPKVAFSKCGLFNEKLKIAQERDMWFRLIKAGYKFFNIPIETTAIRSHSKQVSNTSDKVSEESNKKRLEIIENLDTEVKKKLEHSEYNFYLNMKNFYALNSIKELEIEMDKHIQALRSINSEDSNVNS